MMGMKVGGCESGGGGPGGGHGDGNGAGALPEKMLCLFGCFFRNC